MLTDALTRPSNGKFMTLLSQTWLKTTFVRMCVLKSTGWPVVVEAAVRYSFALKSQDVQKCHTTIYYPFASRRLHYGRVVGCCSSVDGGAATTTAGSVPTWLSVPSRNSCRACEVESCRLRDAQTKARSSSEERHHHHHHHPTL